MTEPEMCSKLVYAGNLEQPPEHCDEYAVGDTDFCPGHQEEDDVWDRADRAYAWLKESRWAHE